MNDFGLERAAEVKCPRSSKVYTVWFDRTAAKPWAIVGEYEIRFSSLASALEAIANEIVKNYY
jgi:hypothetical protein